VDGIQILEAMAPKALTDSITFAAPRAAWAYYTRTLGGKWGQADWIARNPPQGAWFDYYLPRELEGGVSFAVTDSAGRAVRTLSGNGKAGFHRVVWDLVPFDPKERIRREEHAGQPQYVKPGLYKVKITAGTARAIEHSFEVKALPGVNAEGL
jgi:hypothetical protein